MAKDDKRKKVKSRASTKYTTSSDEGSSSEDEDNFLTRFANLNMQQKEKLNELIGAIHEKDELLDSQEEFLIKENNKHVKLKNAYVQEVEKCENFSKELKVCHESISNVRTENANLFAKVEKLNACDNSITNLRNDNARLIAKINKLNESIARLRAENDILISKAKDLNVCNDSISSLRNENDILHAKIDELKSCKPSTSTVEHVAICTRCRYINVDAIHDHLALIKQQNDHKAQLSAKVIMSMKLKMRNLNLLEACSIVGDVLASRMALVSNREAMSSLMHLRDCLILLRAKLPWFRIMRVTFYILLIILSTKLGEFMLGSLILFPIMLLCIRMRHLALGILPMLKCLKRKLLLHQMNLTFHLRPLMHLMCLLTNQAK
jgi:ubiquinone biosynthesis protein UbiJ